MGDKIRQLLTFTTPLLLHEIEQLGKIVESGCIEPGCSISHSLIKTLTVTGLVYRRGNLIMDTALGQDIYTILIDQCINPKTFAHLKSY